MCIFVQKKNTRHPFSNRGSVVFTRLQDNLWTCLSSKCLKWCQQLGFAQCLWRSCNVHSRDKHRKTVQRALGDIWARQIGNYRKVNIFIDLIQLCFNLQVWVYLNWTALLASGDINDSIICAVLLMLSPSISHSFMSLDQCTTEHPHP